MTLWEKAQEAERLWWGTCSNTLGEELKQLVYARYMGIEFYEDHRSPYNIDLGEKSVLDIGGGPCSLLLKAAGGGSLVVMDPLPAPPWIRLRYHEACITQDFLAGEAEMTFPGPYDEVWIYNVLQHTENPQRVAKNALTALKPGGTLRVFEWIDTEINEAHPHSFSRHDLDKMFGVIGKVAYLDYKVDNGCSGPAWYGAFTIGGRAE
jgi:2-polyprenyl-3-methyl-5-hydroxy-6-metoxy-1,4-benzoquinol methylase